MSRPVSLAPGNLQPQSVISERSLQPRPLPSIVAGNPQDGRRPGDKEGAEVLIPPPFDIRPRRSLLPLE